MGASNNIDIIPVERNRLSIVDAMKESARNTRVSTSADSHLPLSCSHAEFLYADEVLIVILF